MITELESRREFEVAKRSAFSFTPASMAEALEISKLVAASDLVPKDYKDKPGNVLVAIQMGAEVGLAPMQALQSIAVINGRPSVWGDGALGLVRASGLLEDFEEQDLAEIQRTGVAVCRALRRGQATPIIRTFSRDDAKRAGLIGKVGPWTQYEPRMLQMRARGFCLRDGFADVLKGLSIREEVQDIEPPIEEQEGARVIDMPRRISEVKAVEAQPEQQATAPPSETPAPEPSQAGPACPTCGGPMRLKPAGKKKDGTPYQAFYSCAGYPDCKGTLRADGGAE